MRISGCFLATMLAFAGWSAILGANDGDIISDVQANQAGLTVHWFTQIQLGREQKLIAAELVVDENESTTFFEITGGGRREVISDKDINAFGEPYGVAGAEQRAKDRMEVIQAELKFHNSSETVKINQYTVPRSTVYALGDGGAMHAIDAETGVQLWQTQIGNRRHPTIGMGASKSYLAVVRGSRVYCLDARTGKVLFEYQCEYAVTNSPAVSEESIFVPLINGALMTLPIKSKGAGTLPLNAVGAARAAPQVAGNLVAWTTDAGYIMVALRENTDVLKFRVKAAGSFNAAPSANNRRLFAVTYGGYVYAIDDTKGNILWNFSIGERVSHSPVAIDDAVYVFSDNNNLYQFNAATGEPAKGWEKSLKNMAAYVGASEDKLYTRDSVGNIVVLDRSTGTRMGQVDSKTQFNTIENVQTDRLYICTNSGLIQCIREIGQTRPYFHAGKEVAADPFAEEPAAGEGKKTEENKNPFGDEGDSKDSGGESDDEIK
jgi:outer membrane protein assembly factor BamB